jgi:predicted signal transduction protein with EAL and GGDEF domain
VQVGASVGVAQWPDDGASADALFEHADRALYQAKAEARPTPVPRDVVALTA